MKTRIKTLATLLFVTLVEFNVGSIATAADVFTTTFSNNIDFNAIVTGDSTASVWSKQVTLIEPATSESVTIDITMSNAAGRNFNKLDGNTRMSILGPLTDPNHVNVDEDPAFDVALVSQTGRVIDVGFNIFSLGLRDTGTPNPSVSWTSSVTTTPVVYTSFTGETDFGMDSSTIFHPLESSNYIGNLDVTADQLQLTDNLGNGIGYTVQFTVIPEPSALVLAAFSLLGLSWYTWRRRR